MANRYELWQNAWRPKPHTPLTVELPADWDSCLYDMEADRLPPLTEEQLRETLRNPLGSPPIRELARRGRTAVIVFDDMSRGTPVAPLAHLVLEELEAGGISGDQVRFLCALGNHAPLTREDFVKKLGEDIVERYAIYNHNPFEHLVKVGVDSAGADVLVNREYMACDVRIGIGACSPHPMNGFSGGGKLLFPGIAGIQTTLANHKRREFSVFSTEPCGLRRDIEAMTRMTGPFFKIDAILNAKLDIVDVYAGDAVEEHRYAMEASRRLNALHRQGEKKDVVVVNANAKYNEALIAVRIGNMELKEGGDLVLINHCPAGQVTHYLYSAFGRDYGGGCWTDWSTRPRSPAGRIIYYTPYPDVTSRYSVNEPDKIVFAKTWEQVLGLLSGHGPGTTAAVISDGTLSYFPR